MRLDYRHELPEASRAMSQLERVVETSTLDPKLRELIKLRLADQRLRLLRGHADEGRGSNG